MSVGHYVRLAGYWFRIESEEQNGLLMFIRYDLEHNTTPASEVHDFLQERMRMTGGQVEGMWRAARARVLTVRWDEERQLLRVKVEQGNGTG
jgi:hypothetical protein